MRVFSRVFIDTQDISQISWTPAHTSSYQDGTEYKVSGCLVIRRKHTSDYQEYRYSEAESKYPEEAYRIITEALKDRAPRYVEIYL